jgi:hypothetical protein
LIRSSIGSDDAVLKPGESDLTDEQPQPPAQPPQRATIAQPDKLLRIGMMVREMLAEARRAPVDEEGRKLLRDIHDRVIHELREVLSSELAEELDAVTIPLGTDVPTESEIRLSQAQLTGWLEGLFHGIQAAFFAQQMQAQGQLDELRRRSLMAGEQGTPEDKRYL